MELELNRFFQPFPNASEELKLLHPLPHGPIVLSESVWAADGGGWRVIPAIPGHIPKSLLQ